jgi:hypothetical protein
MGVSICFHWDPAEGLKQSPLALKKLMTHWTHTAKAFGINTLYCISKQPDAFNIGDSEVTVHNLSSLEELPADKEKVYVEEGGEPLDSYRHPDNCIYIFGSDYGELEKADVSIESKLPLYSQQACAIVLHDRAIKEVSCTLLE